MLCLSKLILAALFLIVDSEGFRFPFIPTRRGIPRLAMAII